MCAAHPAIPFHPTDRTIHGLSRRVSEKARAKQASDRRSGPTPIFSLLYPPFAARRIPSTMSGVGTRSVRGGRSAFGGPRPAFFATL